MAGENWFQTQDGRYLSPDTKAYLSISTAEPIGSFESAERRRAVTGFVDRRYNDLVSGRLGNFDIFEVTAAGCAGLELVVGEMHRADEGRNSPVFHKYRSRTESLFNAAIERGQGAEDETPPEALDPQFHKAFLYLAILGMTRPRLGVSLERLQQYVRLETTKRMIETHEQLQRAYNEPGAEDSLLVRRSLGSRAEYTILSILQRRADDDEPRQAVYFTAPSTVRQDSPFRRHNPESWDANIWSMNGEPARSTGLSLATPPDARIQIKHLGNPEDDQTSDSSVKHVSLVRHVLETQDEDHIDMIVRGLRREAKRSRIRIAPSLRATLDEATLRTRARVNA